MKPITERLVMGRVNRALNDGLQLRKCRTTDTMFRHCGTYWLRDADGRIVKDHIDLEQMGRKMGVIAEWEAVI